MKIILTNLCTQYNIIAIIFTNLHIHVTIHLKVQNILC